MDYLRHSLLSTLILAACCLPAAGLEKVEGFTEPYRTTELAAGEPGILTTVLVHEGDHVRAGQKLGQLDTSVLEHTLRIAQQRSQSFGNLRAAEAELELREKYLASLSQLRVRGHATQRETERAEADVKVARARVAMAREELVLQELECGRIEAQIRRRQIHSPFDGVVSEVFREVGESFVANDPRIVTIVQLSQLRAKFAVEPQQVERLDAERPVQLELVGGQRIDQAMVETVSPVMDAKSATIEVTVLIQNDDELIPSGARCWLLIPDTSERDETAFTATRQPQE